MSSENRLTQAGKKIKLERYLADEFDRVRDGFRKSITITHINQAKSGIAKIDLEITR